MNRIITATLRPRLACLAMVLGVTCGLTAQREFRGVPQATQSPRAIQSPQSGVTHKITLLPSGQAPSSEILLGDVARITPSGIQANRLRNVVLGRAPTSRIARELTPAQVLQSIGAAGFDLSTLQMTGSSRTMVQTVFHRVDGERVKHAARTVLDAVLKAEGAVDPKVKIQLRTEVVGVDVPPGRESMEIFARVKGGQTHATHAIVEVMFEVDGKAWKVIPLSYRLQRFQYVLKPSAPILRGTPLGPNNLVRTIEPATSVIGMYATDFHDVEGMVAKRNLQLGRPLTLTSDAMPPAVIQAGDRVRLIVITGRVKITSVVIARTNAAVGETVELMNPNSGRIIAATAYGPKLAVIDATAPKPQRQ